MEYTLVYNTLPTEDRSTFDPVSTLDWFELPDALDTSKFSHFK